MKYIIIALLLFNNCAKKQNTVIKYEKFQNGSMRARVYDDRQELFLSNTKVIKYDSNEGVEIFKNADYKNNFYILSQFFSPQKYPSTCGPASMKIILSALYVKAGKQFPFDEDGSFDRKYNDTDNLIFRITEKNVFQYIKSDSKFEDYNYIAKQNKKSHIGGMGGVNVENVLNSHSGITATYIKVSTAADDITQISLKKQLDTLARCTKNCSIIKSNYDIKSGLSEFRKNLKSNKFVIAYFSHIKTLPGSTTGHFSPIGAYNSKKDMVLIMDVADYLGSWYWIKVEDLYKTMLYQVGGMDRGYIIVQLQQ